MSWPEHGTRMTLSRPRFPRLLIALLRVFEAIRAFGPERFPHRGDRQSGVDKRRTERGQKSLGTPVASDQRRLATEHELHLLSIITVSITRLVPTPLRCPYSLLLSLSRSNGLHQRSKVKSPRRLWLAGHAISSRLGETVVASSKFSSGLGLWLAVTFQQQQIVQ